MPFEVYGPDGKSVTFPDGTDEATVLRVMGSIYAAPTAPAPAAPKPQEELGFFGAAKRQATTLGGLPAAVGLARGEKGAREELAKEEGPAGAEFGLDKTIGENLQALKETAGGSLGFLAAPAAAGLAGSAVGTPIVGLGAAAATLVSQYFTQNMQRQAQVQQKAVEKGEKPPETATGRALAAAVGEAGLDVAEAFVPVFRPLAAAFPFAKPLLGQAGKKAAGEAAEAVAEAAAKKQLTFKGGIARGVVQGAAVEIPQELAQTALERWQAGLPLNDDEAIKEYQQAAFGAALLGGGIGGIGGAVNVARQPASPTEPPSPEPAASPELLAEFDRLFTAEVASEMQANPDITRGDAAKRVRGRAGNIAEQARANVEAAQAAGVEGAESQPDLDVAGAAGAGVPDIGVPTPPEEATQGLAPAEPVGVAGTGVPAGGVAAPEAGAVGALTPAVDLLEPIKAAPNMAERKKVARPLVSNVVGELVGDAVVPPKVITNIINVVSQEAAKGASFDLKARVSELLTKNNVALPEAAAPIMEAPSVQEAVAPEASPVEQAPAISEGQEAAAPAAEVEVTPPPAPAYTYADLTSEADSLVAPNPDNVLPGQLTAQQFQQFTMEAEAVAAAAEQGIPVPSPVELRQRLYEVVGREAPPLTSEAEAAPAAEPSAAEEYDPEAFNAAQERAPLLWSSFSKQVKGKAPPAWEELDEEAQDNFIGAIMAAPVDATPVEQAKAIRPVFNAIRTGKPVPQVAPETAPAAAAAPAPITAEPAAAAPPAAPPGAPPGAPPVPPVPPSGAAPQPSGKGPKQPKAGKPFALTSKQLEDARRAAGLQQAKANKMQARVANTRKASEVISTSIDIAKLLRGDKANLAILRGMVDTLRTTSWRSLLPTLSTDDIFRILNGRIEGLQSADRIIRQDVTRYEAREYLALAEQMETVAKFLKKFPKAATVLSDLQFMTVAYQVDPTKAATAQDYIDSVDPLLKELRAERAQAADKKERAALSARITTREKAIRAVYDGGVVNGERVYGWQDIKKPEFGGGKLADIFALIRDAHRRDLLNSYNAFRDRIVDTSAEDVVDERLAKLEETFGPALKQTIYFPLMREGSFFLRVGSGTESIFMMFPTLLERNKAMELMRAQGENITEYGDIRDLRRQFQTSGGPLQDVLDMFDADTGGDMDALREQVFDLWLQTTAAGDMTKHMAPRQMRAGYSTNVLKNFASFRRSAVNSTKRALYGHKLKLAFSQARDSVQGTPEQDKMDTFIREIELRAKAKLLPDAPDNGIFRQAIELGNKMAFYQYLANTKTALIQLTQLHVASFPILAQKYGHGKAGAALAKYAFSSLGGFVTSPLKAVKRVDGEVEFDWQQPDLLNNPVTATKQDEDPELYEVLSEGWQAGRDVNMYLDTFAQSVAQMGTSDPLQQTALQKLKEGRVDIAAIRGAKVVFDAMGSLMHQMERVNREATFMAALELGYRNGRKQGLTHEQAKSKAINAAMADTLEATFDFSAYNKPRVFNEGVGRVAGQFFTYPYMLSSLLTRKLFTAIKGSELDPRARTAAAEIAVGTLANIGLYAGLTGLPFYGLTKVIGYALAALFDDDDEEGGLSYFDPETGDLRATYDIDWWFRNVWIPKFFGPGGDIAALLGLNPEQAKLLELSAAKGPISAATDIDLSNSVALDFFFFLPEEPRADTLEGQIVETVFNTVMGASGSMVLDYAKAGRDLMNGYTERAMEKLPKVVSGPLKAARFAKEGQLNYQDELVGMGKDFWTSDKLVLQALNFASTEASRAVEQNYGAKGIEKKIEAESNRVKDRFKKAIRRMEKEQATPEAEAELNESLMAVDKYNQTYPTHPISGPSLAEMARNSVADMRKSQETKGVPFNMEGKTPYLDRLMRERLGE